MKIRFSVSFFLFAAFLLIAGDRLTFLVYILSVILHEYSHNLAGGFFHCKFSEVKLFAFGAVTYGDVEVLKPGEEVIVSLAGPLFNALLALLFTAMWWIVPATYLFTDTVVFANLSLALFNLLPVYPLDGGRILTCLLKQRFGYRRALRFVMALGFAFSAALFGLFVWSAFGELNLTLGVCALMLLWASLSERGEGGLKRLKNLTIDAAALRKGLGVRTLALSDEMTLLEVLRRLNPDYFYELKFYGGRRLTRSMDQFALMELTERFDLGTRVRDLPQKSLQTRGNDVQ